MAEESSCLLERTFLTIADSYSKRVIPILHQRLNAKWMDQRVDRLASYRNNLKNN